MFGRIFRKFVFYKERFFLDNVYEIFIKNNTRADFILDFKINNQTQDLPGEREMPGNEIFLKNQWAEKMLLRYGLAMYLSKGKNVLETCSGLGWGAYLLDGIAERVTCIEIDKKSIDLSKQFWKTDRTEYINGSVLEMPFENNNFDIVTAMESIEHFNLENIIKYLSEAYRVLKYKGILIGSSFFPNTREEADILCSKNKYHLYICTKSEISDILRKQGFKRIKIFKNRLYFIARK